jgi:hypothetical protein
MRVREEEGYRELQGTTENTSLQGAFLITDAPVALGAEVELTILLQHGVQVSSSGKVTRVTHPVPGPNGIAVECAQPFSQLSS